MIYVDEIKTYPTNTIKSQAQRCGTSWCHMWSDIGESELLHFATILKLKKSYIQRGKWLTHFDLISSKRKLAIEYGAIEMDLKDWYKYQKIKKEEDDEKTKERMRISRKEKFKVEIDIEKDFRQFLYDDEIYLKTTQNGFQWSGLQLNTKELIQVYKKIRKHLLKIKDDWKKSDD